MIRLKFLPSGVSASRKETGPGLGELEMKSIAGF